MCGITGFTGKLEDNTKILTNMTDSISHRGPDDAGYFFDERVSLGQRRLSIIDLSSGGHQPMKYKNLTIVFNGEIYNYLEIKKALKEKGYTFNSSSDTEVLLLGYFEYGEIILEMLRGMFAFVIYNEENNKLFFARDRLGIKPFFYTVRKGNFIFGSEIKTILKHPTIDRKINKKVLNSYFQYRYIVGNETFFENILSLEPGYCGYFDIEKSQLEIRQYWDLKAFSTKKDLGEEYYLEKIEKLLSQAVKKRMIADVKVGAYLSGGLDSSLVSAMMQRFTSERIKTFTIGFPEKGFNEFEFSQKVANHIGSEHKEIIIDGEKYIETMESLIEYKDAPLSVPNEVPLYLMSCELKKDITVVLSGEGADEIFGGYGRIFKSYLEFNTNQEFLENFLEKYNYVSDKHIEEIFSQDIKEEITKYNYTKNIILKEYQKVKNIFPGDRIPYIFEKIHLPGLLERVDITTMATGVEARVPFVDHDLVEFVNSIPMKYKIKWNEEYSDEKAKQENLKSKDYSEDLDTPKYILKKIAEKYLPKEIIYRKKVGFPVPLDNWFKGDFLNYSKKILLDTRTLERGIFNKNYLLGEAWIKELSGINIWMMINLELFFRKYFD